MQTVSYTDICFFYMHLNVQRWGQLRIDIHFL
jgi:hypothetical protein